MCETSYKPADRETVARFERALRIALNTPPEKPPKQAMLKGKRKAK